MLTGLGRRTWCRSRRKPPATRSSRTPADPRRGRRAGSAAPPAAGEARRTPPAAPGHAGRGPARPAEAAGPARPCPPSRRSPSRSTAWRRHRSPSSKSGPRAPGRVRRRHERLPRRPAPAAALSPAPSCRRHRGRARRAAARKSAAPCGAACAAPPDPSHLRHGAAVDPEPPLRRQTARAASENLQPNPPLKPHAEHPPASGPAERSEILSAARSDAARTGRSPPPKRPTVPAHFPTRTLRHAIEGTGLGRAARRNRTRHSVPAVDAAPRFAARPPTNRRISGSRPSRSASSASSSFASRERIDRRRSPARWPRAFRPARGSPIDPAAVPVRPSAASASRCRSRPPSGLDEEPSRRRLHRAVEAQRRHAGLRFDRHGRRSHAAPHQLPCCNRRVFGLRRRPQAKSIRAMRRQVSRDHADREYVIERTCFSLGSTPKKDPESAASPGSAIPAQRPRRGEDAPKTTAHDAAPEMMDSPRGSGYPPRPC